MHKRVTHFLRCMNSNQAEDVDVDVSTIEIACVSDIINEFTELDHLQNHFFESITNKKRIVASCFDFFMTSVESVSLNERSTHIHIARMTFSTLFSRGVVSFNSSRMRTISLIDYNTHVMSYRDDRFVRHSQFRY